MGSLARTAFTENSKNVQHLLDIHETIGGTAKGKRATQLEVLNKSAIVFISSIWESYCEDIAAEALEHIVKYADADDLPDGIKRIVAAELKRDANELAIWQIADEGWKSFLSIRLVKLQDQRNRKLNTPKAQPIQDLFMQAVGIEDITKKWTWKNMSVKQARDKLDKYISMRGDIAHRGKAAKACSKAQVTDFFNHVESLVSKTGGSVNTYVKSITKTSLW